MIQIAPAWYASFTFHFGSINTRIDTVSQIFRNVFTFHFGSINTETK